MDERAVVAHRARAAFVWLSRADNGAAVDEVRAAYSCASRLMRHCGDTIGECVVQLVHDVSIGSVSESTTTADRLVAMTSTAASPAQRARLIRSASLAFRLANEPDRALTVLETAYELCERHRLPQSAIATLSLAGAVAIEEARLEIANSQLRRLDQWTIDPRDAISLLDGLLLRSRVELLTGRFSRGVAELQSYDWSTIDTTTPRSRALLLSTRVHLARVQNDDAALRSFGQRLHLVLRDAWRTPCADYTVGAAAFAEASLRGVESATSLVSEFLRSVRRQLGPARSLLGAFIRESAPHLLEQPIEEGKTLHRRQAR